MNQDNNTGPFRPKLPSARRMTLMASVAVLCGAAFVGGAIASHDVRTADAAKTAVITDASHPIGFADLVSKVQPAVISVRVEINQPADASDSETSSDGTQAAPGSPFGQYFFRFGPAAPRNEMMIGEGSGFFISPDGYAVTNNHVVDHAKTVRVTTNDGRSYTAKVIGTDQKTDLALIKVDAENLPYVSFAKQEPRVGDWVVAIGNPYGLGGTVTAGIVSAHGRAIDSSPYDDYIQIDAPINKGNSGGPAFDVNGNVIGVNTAIYSPSGGSIGIGFDIPATTANNVIEQLKEKHHVTRGWVGVSVQPVTTGIAESLGMQKPEGALVDETDPSGPAAKAGIKPGDVITSIGGAAIKNSRELAQKAGSIAPGTPAELTILRDGQTKTVKLQLGTMPDQQQASAAAQPQDKKTDDRKGASLGLALAPANSVNGDQKGVAVVAINPDGPAADTGLQVGDIILDISGKAVQTPKDVRDGLAAAHAQQKQKVLARVRSGSMTKFVALPATG